MAGPQTYGRYKIEGILGKGAMGVVYKALDPKLHRTVAIKTIQISQLDEDTSKDFSMRFEREAHAVARLNHPNIVQVYDFGEEGGVAYLVMEFIKGNELKSALAANPVFDRKESVRIMCELLDALDYAHEAGVVHRDIEPANVMLDSQGRAKLTDFGVARVTDSDRTSAERTQAGTTVGTPAYMSPEQIQGQRVDRRSDIFSAGIVLYQFLTGQKPFTGEGAWTIAKKIIQDDPPMPSSLNVAVSPEFDRVVAKALAKDRDKRFSTAREFAQALKRAAEGKPALEEAPTLVVSPRAVPQATVGAPRDPATPPVRSGVTQREATSPQALQSGEMELEFWRSIKDSEDPHDFELYVQQFPQGIYASLAGRRVAKLRGLPGAEDSGSRPAERTTDGTRLHTGVPRAGAEAKAMREAAERTRPAADKTVKLSRAASPAAEPVTAPTGGKSPMLLLAIFSLLAVTGAAAYLFVIRPSPPAATAPGMAAEEKAKAAEKARLAAEARAQAEAKAQRDAELQAKREAEAKAQRDAELQAGREAETKAKAGADLQATRNAAAKAKREAELKAQAASEAKAKAARDAEAQVKRDAQAQAKREADARAKREADARTSLASESSLWDSIKASNNTEDFQKYLNLYPNGKNADRARKRLAVLEKARLDELKRAEKKKSAIVVPTF